MTGHIELEQDHKMTTKVDQLWLDSTSVKRMLLVEVTINKLTSVKVGTDTIATGTQTLFFSTHGYITTSSDVYYQPLVHKDFSITESISTSGPTSTTYSDVELFNPNGDLDPYLDPSQYIWTNGTIKIYYGDPSWVTADITAVHTDFLLVFSGNISDIDSRNRNSVNIKIADKMQLLDYPITETKLGATGTWGSGTQTNSDNIIPLIFGEVFNIAPILRDPSLLEYIICRDPIEQLIELRDNGIPIYNWSTGWFTTPGDISNITTTGIFRLGNPLVGELTASVQGIKDSIVLSNIPPTLSTGVYNNNIANMVSLICTQYGLSTKRILLSVLDQTNLNAFAIANPVPAGVLVTDASSVLEICNNLVGSIGGQLFFSRLGLLQILRFGTYTSDTVVDINASNILNNTFNISNRTIVEASTNIGYAKNWKVQEGLLTAIPEAHKASYAKEWLSVTNTNATASTNYKLSSTSNQIDTMLITTATATAEASRRTTLFSKVITTYSFTGTTSLMGLKLGQAVNLVYSRFNLWNGGVGTMAQVVSLKPNWVHGTVEVEVIA